MVIMLAGLFLKLKTALSSGNETEEVTGDMSRPPEHADYFSIIEEAPMLVAKEVVK